MSDKQNVYSVSISVRIAANNPVEAALSLKNVLNQAGADKYTVVDLASKNESVVDIGLLAGLGLFNEQPEDLQEDLATANTEA